MVDPETLMLLKEASEKGKVIVKTGMEGVSKAMEMEDEDVDKVSRGGTILTVFVLILMILIILYYYIQHNGFSLADFMRV